MVGNKAQKAVAAALTGMLALGSVVPAFASTTLSNDWTRLDGSWKQTWAMYANNFAISGTGKVDGVDRYDTMRQAVALNMQDDANYFLGTIPPTAPRLDTTWGFAPTKWLGSTDAVLVSGTSYADALAAAGLAGVLDAPVITTPGDKLGEDAAELLTFMAENATGGRLTVHIVGGTAAVSEQVEKDVRDLVSEYYTNGDHTGHGTAGVATSGISYGVLRYAGADRTETSLKVMKKIGTYGSAVTSWQGTNMPFTNGKPVVFVANGWSWADALSVSSYAYMAQAPILLTGRDGKLTQAQLDEISSYNDNRVDVKVIGGPAEDALDQFEATLKENGFKAASVDYIAGDDRYDTSAKVVEQLGYYGDVAVATGRNWPDALVGGPFMGARGGTLVLVGEPDKEDNWDAAIEQIVSMRQAAGTSNFNGADATREQSVWTLNEAADQYGATWQHSHVQWNDGDHFILGGEAAVSKSAEDWLSRY